MIQIDATATLPPPSTKMWTKNHKMVSLMLFTYSVTIRHSLRYIHCVRREWDECQGTAADNTFHFRFSLSGSTVIRHFSDIYIFSMAWDGEGVTFFQTKSIAIQFFPKRQR